MWKRKSRQNPLPLTDEQIRAKAHELWQKREGKGGSAEDDWQQAIAELESAASQPNSQKKTLEAFGNKEDREFALKVKQFQWERLKTLISALGLAATIFAGVGLYLTYKTGQEQQQLAREQQQQNAERLITERFAKAVEQLGSPQLDVRIGAIYSLERLAKDSPKDHWTIMEVLTTFVRNRSPLKKTPEDKKPQKAVTLDVQSALTVIGRRDLKNDLQNGRLNLAKTNLTQADLTGANLQKVVLQGANLQQAVLDGASLQEVVLTGGNLQKADLFKTNLQKADLRGASLQEALLQEANLQEVFLQGANLQKAILTGANLQEAVLFKTNLQEAVLWEANLQQALLQETNLKKAFLFETNLKKALLFKTDLQETILKEANLRETILMATDLRTASVNQQQLAGNNPPLLCNVALPKAIKINPNRDCDRLPQELVKRSPDSDLKHAKHIVDEARQRKWE